MKSESQDKTLVIISHTPHYKSRGGVIVGWGPTTREINYLTNVFKTIYHVAPLHEGDAPPSALPYASTKIKFLEIVPTGSEVWYKKINVLLNSFTTLRQVNLAIRNSDYFQFRAPTGIGNYLIPYLTFFISKPGWFKYAGNWNAQSPPLGYRWQRHFLVNFQKRRVTINGKWKGQKSHLLSFENPCLTKLEREEGQKTVIEKRAESRTVFNLCFVGNLTENKGVSCILEALKFSDRRDIGIVHFVGDGEKRAIYEEIASNLDLNIKFHGYLPKEKVNEVLIKSHLLLLPTESEGFPKVVAEAANYGCIPIVTAVSSIPQYIKDGVNGYLLENRDPGTLKSVLDTALKQSGSFNDQRQKGWEMAQKFTYEYYNQQLVEKVL